MKKEDHPVDDYLKLYWHFILRNLQRMVDYHTAEDICQEAFLRLVQHLDHVPPKMVKAWLKEVSERLARDVLRKGGKYKTTVGLEIDEIDMPDEHSDTERILEELEESSKKRKVLECLKREKPEWYDVLLMWHLENMNDKEIGREIRIRPELAAQWRHRATLWLRARYAAEYGEKER